VVVWLLVILLFLDYFNDYDNEVETGSVLMETKRYREEVLLPNEFIVLRCTMQYIARQPASWFIAVWMVLKILWGFKRLKESSLLWRQAEREIPMTMKDWINHVDDILKATNENVLTNSETVSTAQKDQKVVEEYKKYKQKTLSAVERDYLNSIREVYQLARVGENN